MLVLTLDEGGKKFQHEWIFRNLSLSIQTEMKLAITGSNGSGKSTLLKCLAGQMPFTKGKLVLKINGDMVPDERIYKQLAISAPYLELPEEFTLMEFLKFHFKFKNITDQLSLKDLSEKLFLENSLNKPISNFSSGMKQRLKLGICFFSDAPLIFLDEPTSNLDKKGVDWYRNLVIDHGGNKCLIIASNDKREYDFCEQTVKLEDYKI